MCGREFLMSCTWIIVSEQIMELIEGKGYFYKKVEYFAQEYPDKLALGDVAGNTATMKDVLTICEETGFFLENLGLKGYERIAILSNSGFSQCLLHLPLGEKAVIVPIDNNTHPDKIEAVFKLFFVDYIITDNIGDKHSKTASEAGLGIISYKLTGNSGNLHISLERVQEPADMDRGLEHKKCHHLFIMTTSGTTSVPKVVPINYRAVQSAVEEIGERYKVGVGDVFLTPVPMNKITNMTLCIFRQHPDTDIGSIRTAYRKHPDSISEVSGQHIGNIRTPCQFELKTGTLSLEN